MNDRDIVKDYYDSAPEAEWARLERSPWEFEINCVYLDGYIRPGERVLDLGGGPGRYSIHLAKRGANVTAVEFQPWAADLTRRNAALNNLSDKISVYEGDINGCGKVLPVFDAAVSNPPYFRAGSGEVRGDVRSALSRHESTCTLEDLARESARLLREGGRFYMVHKVERMAEALTRLSNNNLQPKQVTLIYPKPDRQADIFIVTAVKGGRPGMKLSSLTVYGRDGEMTAEAAKLYGKI